MPRRNKLILAIYLFGITTILCMPFLIMRISDARFFSAAHERTAADYHIETSADDVPYVEHIINTYMTYADSKNETVLIQSDGGKTLYEDECIDIAYAELLELTKRGVINPLWFNEELQNFTESNYFSIREYYSKDEAAEGTEEIKFSIIMWNSGEQYLRLRYDQKYKRLLEIYYNGGGQIFATNDTEKLCNSFAAYQGLDILEDWSFNGKRLVSQKASLSIECEQKDEGAVLQIIPKDLMLIVSEE